MERTKLQSWLNFITSELHKGFSPLFNPSMPDEAKKIFRERLATRFAHLDKHLASNDYLMGKSFSVADAYLFVVSNWASRVDVDLSPLRQRAGLPQARRRPARGAGGDEGRRADQVAGCRTDEHCQERSRGRTMRVRPFHFRTGDRHAPQSYRHSSASLAGLVLASWLATAHRPNRRRAASRSRAASTCRFGGCIDCHTPGYFFGKPDMPGRCAGSEVGFEIPGLGVFYGPNLTPDKETGLGNWSKAQIVTALQKGTRPDGRVLAPIMPWTAFANLTKRDAEAIAAYLRACRR